MSYYEKPFPSAALDTWITSEPQRDETPECGDYYALEICSYCEQEKQVCQNCRMCFSCENKMESDEARYDSPCED